MNATTENAGTEPLSKRASIMETLKNYASLSTLLRTLGAGVLVASVSMFLFKGWSSSNDVERYFMLLAHTVALAITGVIIGYWVKESKGARLFLILSLISTVVNYSVLGGLLYSQVQWDGARTFYPQFARWNAGTLSTALTTAGIGWALLVPVAWISFMALARRSVWRLTLLFLFAGSALLIPVRETAYVAVTVGIVTFVLLFHVIRAKKRDSTLTTPEGRFSRLILFSMPVLMVGRGMFLYGADIMMFTVISALVMLVVRQVAVDAQLSTRTRTILNRLSVIPAIATALGITGVLADNNWIPESLWIPMFVLTGAALLLEISMRSPVGGSGYRRFAGMMVSLGVLVNLWAIPNVDTALISTTTGLIVTILGYSGKQRFVFGTGLAAFLVGVVYQCSIAFSVFDFSSWSALAAVGIFAIVAGSVLERHGAVIKVRLSDWRQSFQQWQN